MGKAFVFGMFGLIVIGLIFAATVFIPIGLRWARKVLSK
jgi:hypothetical protein